MRKFETQAEFKARMCKILGIAVRPTNHTRIGSRLRFACGDRVYDKGDPRHVGAVQAITSKNVIILKFDNGWISEIDLDDAVKDGE